MSTKKKFTELIKKASQPLKVLEKMRQPGHGGDYTGKKTRQRKVGGISEKRNDKSR